MCRTRTSSSVRLQMCQHCKVLGHLQAQRWSSSFHDDVIKWTHFPRYWRFVRWPVNSPHKCQWRRSLMFYLIGAWINGWVNNREAGDLRRRRAHYDVTVMSPMVTPRKDQWRGALMFSLIWTNGWTNNRDASDLRRHRAHYDVTVMSRTTSWRDDDPIRYHQQP